MGRQDGESECLLNREKKCAKVELSLCSHWKRRKEFMVFFSFSYPATESARRFGVVQGLCCCVWTFSSVASKGFSLLPWAGFSLSWLRSLQSTGVGEGPLQLQHSVVDSAVVAHTSLLCSMRHLPEPRTERMSSVLQEDSYPLHHQQGPRKVFISYLISFNWQCLPHADFVSPSFLFPSPFSLCPGVICKQAHLPMTRHLNLPAMDCW